MSEQVVGLDKDNNGTGKKPVHGYESSSWLARWTQPGVEAAKPSPSRLSLKEDGKCSKESSVIGPETVVDEAEENLKENHGGEEHGNEGCTEATRTVQDTRWNVFQAYPRKEVTSSFHEGESSSSKAMPIGRPSMPSWIHSQRRTTLLAPGFGPNHDPHIPGRVMSTRNPLDDFISPTVDSGDATFGEPDGQVFRDSRVSMKLKRKTFGGFPDLDLRHREGVWQKSPSSSKDGPGRIDKVKSSAVYARNGSSSAETDTLEMDDSPRIRLSGSASPLSPKVQGGRTQSPVPQVEIPDMNQEPPVVPDGEKAAVGSHGREASTSETQTMKVEHFLSETELRREGKRVRSDPEPFSLWIKRLKTSASSSGGEEVNDFFHRIIKRGITNPEPRSEEPSSRSEFKNRKAGGEEITLEHPWIRRWCQSKGERSHQKAAAREAKSEAGANTTKETAVEEIEKKQFPSLAAMALMGKALRGLSPSGLKKSGSMIIWNTPDLR